jgi:hypothetical protein
MAPCPSIVIKVNKAITKIASVKYDRAEELLRFIAGAVPPGLTLATDGNFYGASDEGLYQLTRLGIYTQLANPGEGYRRKSLWNERVRWDC